MISINRHVDLTSYNTMGVRIFANYFVEIHSIDELLEALKYARENNISTIVLGGGSNILFLNDFDGLVILNRMLGIEILSENEQNVILKVGAGENWHQFVLYCIENGFGGIENLSLIPGSVGAAPIQNIGAYGVEIENVILTVEFYSIIEKCRKVFSKSECNFGYRDSIFKNELKNEVIITSVTFELSKNGLPKFEYSSLKEKLFELSIIKPTIKDVSNAVIKIRESKLPDPKEIGNTGSFFKNPVIDFKVYTKLLEMFPNMPSYPISKQEVKIPAGWLIEQCGWKGKRIGDAGVHEKQALVLVNHGKASGAEIWALAEEVMESVHKKFDIRLSPEVNILI